MVKRQRRRPDGGIITMRKIITLGLFLAILLLVQAWQNSTLIAIPAPIITAQVFNKRPAQTTHKRLQV